MTEPFTRKLGWRARDLCDFHPTLHCFKRHKKNSISLCRKYKIRSSAPLHDPDADDKLCKACLEKFGKL